MPKDHDGPCVDIDPFIPTGTCAICANVPQETEPPEERTPNVEDD